MNALAATVALIRECFVRSLLFRLNSCSVSDGYADYCVTLFDSVNDILSCCDFSKHSMFAI